MEGGGYVWSLFCCGVLSVVFSFFNHLAGEAIASLLLMTCDHYYFVSPPHSAMGWSPACDCDISWSYSLTVWPLSVAGPTVAQLEVFFSSDYLGVMIHFLCFIMVC